MLILLSTRFNIYIRGRSNDSHHSKETVLRKHILLQMTFPHHQQQSQCANPEAALWCSFYLGKVVLLSNVDAQSSWSLCLVQPGHINRAGFTHYHKKQSGCLLLEISFALGAELKLGVSSKCSDCLSLTLHLQ